MQLHSQWSFRPSANGLANALACSKGYSAIQAPVTRLTCRIPSFRDGDSIVKTTSALVGPLCEIIIIYQNQYSHVVWEIDEKSILWIRKNNI
jgi:hypothetical protein